MIIIFNRDHSLNRWVYKKQLKFKLFEEYNPNQEPYSLFPGIHQMNFEIILWLGIVKIQFYLIF